MRPETPNEYIQKHLDIMDPKLVEEARERLSLPLGESQLAEAGEAHLAHGPFSIDYAYDKAEGAKLSTVEGELLPMEDMRELKAFSFAKDGVNQKLDLAALLPPGYKVYFMKGNGDHGWSSYADVRADYIVMDREPSSPEALLILLHELGHGHTEGKGDHKFTPEKERLASGDVTDLADKLLVERNAWSYALRKLKPFLDTGPKAEEFSITKSDVMARIKGRALQSYQSYIERVARYKSSMYMSRSEEEWMTSEPEWLKDFDEDKLEASEE